MRNETIITLAKVMRRSGFRSESTLERVSASEARRSGQTEVWILNEAKYLDISAHPLNPSFNPHSAVEDLEFVFMLECVFDERVRALQIEFLADVSAVIFDGARADSQIGGDFAAGFQLGEQK